MKCRALLLVVCCWVMPAMAEETGDAAAPAATVPGQNPDPWQTYNRAVFTFNDTLDRYFAKPLARGYRRVAPRQVRTGVSNFFENLGTPVTILNDLLQGKPRDAGTDTVRFFMNSVWGVAGFVDVGTRMGIPKNDEDFGQTLGKWGAGPGPYLVLPILGPSSVRDGIGYGADVASNPRTWIIEPEVNVGIAAVYAINTRANLLEVEDIVQGDRYLFIRDLYLQRREFLVRDGQVESDPFLDDDEESEESEESAEPEAPAESSEAAPEQGSGSDEADAESTDAEAVDTAASGHAESVAEEE